MGSEFEMKNGIFTSDESVIMKERWCVAPFQHILEKDFVFLELALAFAR